MATKRKAENVSPEQLKKIWSKISANDWFQLLNEFKSTHGWQQRGAKIHGRCVYHTEKEPSFYIDTAKGYAHCFGASCPTKHVWNPVRLVADIMGIGYAQAIRQLKNRYGVALPTAYASNIQKIEENDELKKILRVVMNRELRDALVEPENPKFSYIETTKLIPWFRQRKIPEDVLHQLPIGVMPTHERLYERLEELPNGRNFREAAHTYLRDCFTTPGNPLKYEGFMAFFYYKSPTEIGRIRVRRPNTRKIYAIEDPYDDRVGFFGLNMYPELMDNLENHPLYVIEGDFDALSVIAHQLNTGKSDICIVGTGGTMMESQVDTLTTFGFKKMFLIPDNDQAGIDWAREILKNSESVSKIFKWDDEQDQHIKDVDQAIRVHGFGTFYTRLTSDSNFQFNHEWAAEQAKRRIEALSAGDVEARSQVAVDFGTALKRDSERETFVELISQEFGLPHDTIMQGMVPDDTPEGFKLRIARRLREEYYFLSEETIGASGTVVLAWSRRKRIIRKFLMDSDKKIRAALERDIGDIEEYTKKHLGIPDFILYRTGPRGRLVTRSDTDVSKQIMHYFARALSNAAENTEPSSRLIRLGQGVHYINDPDEGDPAIYVVNGTYFFRGKFSDDGNTVIYESIDCPRYDRYIFSLGNQQDDKPWSVNIKTVKDLQEAGLEYDPKDVYKKVKKIFDLGWKFYHHELESMFLAADVMYTPVADLFKTVVMSDVTGVTHSGKTTLLQIIGGNEFPGYKLCEATRVLSDFSSAGVRNLMSGHRLRLCIDEFEDNDFGVGKPSRKSLAVREMLDVFRNMASGGTESVRANTSGEYLAFKLEFPVTVSGIYTMQEARDLNRFIHIQTQRIEGFTNPIIPIQKKFSIKDMQKLRRMITLCWFPRVPELLRTFEEVKAEFSEGANLPAGMYSRLVDNFLPAAAILKYVGEDYVSFVQKFSELKMRELIDQGGATKESAEIWGEILHAPIALYQMARDAEETISSVIKLIADPHKHYLLDKIDLGVYFIPERMWLVVFWNKAASGVLKNSSKYKGVQHHGRLKMVADMDPRVVPREQLARGNFLSQEVWPRVNAQIGLNEISVINLEGTVVLANDEEPAIRDGQRRNRMMDDIAHGAGAKTKRGNFDV